MATLNEVEQLRRMVDETDSDTWSDDDLKAMVDTDGIDAAAARIWLLKAASFAGLVDVSEAGSSRKNGDLYKHAIEMASKFEPSSSSTGGEGIDWPTTREITR